ncbi:MAG: enoyl-CoA hydratase [Acidimicrobiia bacterium]
MSDSVVLYEVRDDGVAVITLNRPDRMNAWTHELDELYFATLQKANADTNVRAVVVTGSGRGFSAGADMEILQGLDGERPPTALSPKTGRPLPFKHLQHEVLSVNKPVIAAINGAAAGMSLVQALLCDVRFAAAGAKFTFAFSQRGLAAEYGASWILPRIVGVSTALDLLFSSRVILAEEAKELGIVQRVVPGDQLLEEAIAYAANLAANCAPRSMAVIKRQVYRHIGMEMQDAMDETFEVMVDLITGPDFKEGVASFVEKRSPNFNPVGADFDPGI